MARYADTSQETIRQRSSWLIPLGVLLVTSVLAALFLLFYLAPSPRTLFQEQVTFTPASDPVALRIHGHRFRIPANYLIYRSQRQGGDRKEINLIALLPRLEGYSDWEDGGFRDNTARATTVKMLLHEDPIRLPEAEWLKRIYGPYIVDPRGTASSFGLTAFRFRADSGYRDEDLFVGYSSHQTIVIQCDRLSEDTPSPNCHRDLPVADGVALSYRFKRAQLGQWRDIAGRIDGLMKSFRQS